MKKLKLVTCLSLSLCTQALFGNMHLFTSQNNVTGESVSAWENYGMMGNEIFANIHSSGTWGSSSNVSFPLTFPTYPRTAINESSQMVIVWLGNDLATFTQSLYGSFYISGTWTTSLLSDPLSEYVIGDHQVKIADDGSVLVTWSGYMFSSGQNEPRSIYAPTYGTWTSPVTIP